MPPAPAYRVEDRSVLLPHYKRLLVDPVLAHVPARLSPNAITHVGHLLCLSALLVLVARAARLGARGERAAAPRVPLV